MQVFTLNRSVNSTDVVFVVVNVACMLTQDNTILNSFLATNGRGGGTVG